MELKLSVLKSKKGMLFAWLLIYFIFNATDVYTQVEKPVELNVKFEEGVVGLLENKVELTPSEIEVKHTELQNIIKRVAKSLKKALPNFRKEDRNITLSTGESITISDWSNVFIVTLSKKDSVDQVIDLLNKAPGVIYAERNKSMYKLDLTPNDQYYSQQWGLNHYLDNDIDAPEAWDITTGSSVVVGVVDGGVRETHNDLSGRVNGDAGFFAKYGGHGTAVAGIIAAKGYDGFGVAGVNWNAIINDQAVDFDTADIWDFINAINAAISSGSRILNLSYGSYSPYITLSGKYADAYKQNKILVASSGNDSTDAYHVPSGLMGVLSVGSISASGQRAASSNYGSTLDLVAPGVAIYTLSDTTDSNFKSARYGTSFAAPHVSGVASLLISENPNLYNDDVYNILELSAKDLGAAGWDQYYGHGLVKAKDALDLIRAPYSLNYYSTSNGYLHSTSNTYSMSIYDHPGLAGGVYVVKRHEVRKYVTFAPKSDINVWGRNVGTTGWSNSNPNFTAGWCEPVEGSVTSSSATLRTYVYELWNSLGQYVGWYPCQPSQVSFAFTVHGTPPPFQVDVDGETYLHEYETGTWTANAQYGTTPYSYQWYLSYNGTSWSTVGTNSSSYSRTAGAAPDEFYVKCIVTDNDSNTDEDQVHVLVGTEWKISGPPNNVPKEFTLSQNYPNPFNPVTSIQFALPEAANVKLVVYDITGKEVAKLLNRNMSAGYHSVDWDASKMSSGVYLYKIEAGKYSAVKRMVLVK